MTDPSLLSVSPTPSTVALSEKDSSLDHFVWAITQAADDRKAEDIVVLKVTDVSYLADYFV
ncbi:MAG: RsfS/YbeB/iojap family protein, partial [Snowella sp.]